MMPGDGGLGQELTKLGIPFSKVPFWSWMGHKSIWDKTQSAARNLLLSFPTALKLRKWNPDIVYSNSMTICFGALLAKLLRRPHVWHLHEMGFEDHGLQFDFGEKLSYKLMNSGSACIAISQVVADKFAKHIAPSKITVMFQSVHHWAHRQRHTPTNAKNDVAPPRAQLLRCVIVGRLSEGKRQEDAVEAIAELRRMGIDAGLLMAGPGNAGYVA